MFAEILNSRPMETLLSGAAAWAVPPARDPAWNCVAPAYRQEISRLADAYRTTPYPMRLASRFLDFVRTGSRSADEESYFLRRRKLCVSALSCCMGNDADLDAVVDGIVCICEETAWVISAHNVNPIPGAPKPAEYPLPDPQKPYIDLFTAQTGMILALVRQMLGKQLDAVSPVLNRRIGDEIARRILTPFMENDDFWWMGFRRKDLCNWTPWIVSNVLVCACLSALEKQPLAALLDRACRMLDRWLDVVPRDGGCDEGAGYWNMAGGALLDCLETLEQLTGGALTLWDNEKIRNILSFPRKAELDGGWFVNFADCDARPFLSGERLQFAGEKLGDPSLTAMGCRLRGTLEDQLSDVPHLTRALRLLFHPAGKAVEEKEKPDVWLPDLQVRVVHRGPWTLCCKGGHNGESHNHNDVGSFMLYLEGRPEIVDAGNMTYTAKTFSDQRYTLWNVRSAYHNVPLIGDREQLPGAAFAARQVRCEQDGLSLDMAAAYGDVAKTLRRRLTLTAEGLTVEDCVELSNPRPVAWVFLFRYRPECRDGAVEDGSVRLTFPAGMRAEAEEIPVTDPRMARNFPGSLWRVLVRGEAQKAVFTVRRKEHA